MSSHLSLLTPTWAGDYLPIKLLRASIEQSPLADTQHVLVVQTEDRQLFREFAGPHLQLVPTADILPAGVEAMRVRAARLGALCGRAATRVLGSSRRRFGWPAWVGYTGWHIQQISKLMWTQRSGAETTVILDSDVVVTPNARPDNFVGPGGRIPCYSVLAPGDRVSPRVTHWNEQATALFRADAARRSQPAEGQMPLQETAFDTPFIFRAALVRAMCEWLEQHYSAPWWEVLLAQPPRRWSEFASYRAYLRTHGTEAPVDWIAPTNQRYLFDASDPTALAARVAGYLNDPAVHYITIHSQSSGRQLWKAEDYIPSLLNFIHTGQGLI